MQLGKEKRKPGMIASAATGGAVAVLGAFILITVFSALSLMSDDPAKLSWLGIATLLVCAFAGAVTGAKCTDQRPFLAGLLAFLIYFGTVLAVALSVPGTLRPLLIPFAVLCGIAGAFIGSIRSDKKRRIPAFETGIR